ncbi:MULTISPECIES: hypothetical protein [unclassified Streptomyces]|uniref:hypothetical protein n=1 Tax=unclassified Streptomyces TaxID=2593676 RepID=UPI00224CE6DF|nr:MULTISPECIES: hypothetical protein [unclassified Streptomyces]MCX4405968.1 hypothetical protein [Streptomyces sp. NBC_01764]MCX5189508.1 hypothetical protein [Streptomyces sp. NBC_00268]
MKILVYTVEVFDPTTTATVGFFTIRTADTWTGYIGSDRQRFTTWCGGVLGKVIS